MQISAPFLLRYGGTRQRLSCVSVAVSNRGEKENKTMNFNTKDRIDFITDHVFYVVPVCLVYYLALFRPIGTRSYAASIWILIGMTVVCCIIGIALDMRRERNSESVYTNVVVVQAMIYTRKQSVLF